MRTQARPTRGTSDPVRIVFQPRDYEALGLIGTARYVTTEQITRTFFSSASRARRRIRRWYEAGIVNLHLTDSREPNLVTLTRRGLGELVHHDPDFDGRIHLPGPIRASGVRHHVLLTDARLYVAALVERDPTVTNFRWSNPGGELHRILALRDYHIDPDGVARIDRRDERLVLAVEADAGGHEPGKVWASKYARYAQPLATRLLDELWIAVDEGNGRRTSLARLARTAGLANRVRVLDRDHVTTRPVTPPPPTVNESPDAR